MSSPRPAPTTTCSCAPVAILLWLAVIAATYALYRWVTS